MVFDKRWVSFVVCRPSSPPFTLRCFGVPATWVDRITSGYDAAKLSIYEYSLCLINCILASLSRDLRTFKLAKKYNVGLAEKCMEK
jgi:hypothetical protein